MEAKQEIKKAAEEALNEIKRARDEIKLKLHLGGMDAADAWHEIEPSLARAEEALRQRLSVVAQAAEGTAQEIRLQGHLALEEAKDRWRELEPSVRKLLRQLKGPKSN